MRQFLADQIDQLDLALDQLAMHDRNFDRFAMMLIDNVIELTLHQYARDCANENEGWGRYSSKPKHDQKAVAAALGQNFDPKIRLARSNQLITDSTADSIQYLHSYRNTTYHKGLRHEGILHSLAAFHFYNACIVLKNYRPRFWSWGSRDHLSHRAIKYLGNPTNSAGQAGAFQKAYDRLLEVCQSLGDSLIEDLHADMGKTIDLVDEELLFLVKDSPETTTRKQVIIDAQVWPFAFTDEGKEWAKNNGCPSLSIADRVGWLANNYPWPIKNDPISSWRKRQLAVKAEKDKDMALKKYCDFMRQTEEFRSKIDEAAAQLDGYIQNQIDIARGK